jgi:RNA recognition motif-containing protein
MRKNNEEITMQGSKLYIGNLKYSVTSEQLEEFFSQHGDVKHANVVGGKGFGFVELSSPGEAQAVKEALDGAEFEGRELRIDKARSSKHGQRAGGGARDS